jgi:hypothetical protein
MNGYPASAADIQHATKAYIQLQASDIQHTTTSDIQHLTFGISHAVTVDIHHKTSYTYLYTMEQKVISSTSPTQVSSNLPHVTNIQTPQ